LQELTSLSLESGQPAYRGQQMFDAVYRQKIDRLDQVSTLPSEYRARLTEEGRQVGLPAIARKFVSSDGTARYLMELSMRDGGDSLDAGGRWRGDWRRQ